MSGPLIHLRQAVTPLAFTDEAHALRDEALASALLVNEVTNPQQQQVAVDAQLKLAGLIRLVESSRKAGKEPILEAGRALDKACKDFVADAAAEELRIAKLVGDYQALEIAKVRAAEASRVAELSALETERQQRLAEAHTHEERDRINEQFDAMARESSPLPTRAKGQSVREDWEIEVYDLLALARAHPRAVDFVPKMAEIRYMLDAGVKVQGVKATKAVKSGVRTEKRNSLNA